MARFRLAPLAVGLLLLTGAASPPAPRLSVHIQRSSFDLLDTISIGIVLDNPGNVPVEITFPLPTEYAIEVLHGKAVIWSSLPADAPAIGVPPHVRPVAPGASTLATYDWNAIAADGSSPGPGEYIVRVRLLEARAQPTAQTRIRFIDPTPISAIGALRLGDEITIAGRLDPLRSTLTDSTGSTLLSRRLLPATADGPVVVRGYILAGPAGIRFLSVQRWTTIDSL